MELRLEVIASMDINIARVKISKCGRRKEKRIKTHVSHPRFKIQERRSSSGRRCMYCTALHEYDTRLVREFFTRDTDQTQTQHSARDTRRKRGCGWASLAEREQSQCRKRGERGWRAPWGVALRVRLRSTAPVHYDARILREQEITCPREPTAATRVPWRMRP